MAARHNRLGISTDTERKHSIDTEFLFPKLDPAEHAALVMAGFKVEEIEAICGQKVDTEEFNSIIRNGRKMLTERILSVLVGLAQGYTIETVSTTYDTQVARKTGIEYDSGKEFTSRTVKRQMQKPDFEAIKFILANMAGMTQDPIKNKLLENKVKETM